MEWSPYQLRIIKFFRGENWTSEMPPPRANDEWLKTLPLQARRFKCHDCHTIFNVDEVDVDGSCVKCHGHHLVPMCPLDHCHCNSMTGKPIIGIEYCPVCGNIICPCCGTHDIAGISRVTGYMQDVTGFNEAKKQELKDRVRWNLSEGDKK